MRRTELTLMPLAPAMAVAVQWVVSPGGSAKVSATTRSATSCGSGGMRDGREAVAPPERALVLCVDEKSHVWMAPGSQGGN